MGKVTDEYLVELICNGNPHMFSEIVDRYKDRVYSLATKLINTQSDAQDLAQEVFIKVFKELHKFEYRSSFSTWIYKVTYNTCMDYNRKNKKWFKLLNFDHETENSVSIINVEEKAIENQTQDYLKKQVFGLNEKYRTVIILYHFEGLSYEKISEILNVPLKTVETRLYRGRKILKQGMEKYINGGECYGLQFGEKSL